MPDVRRVLLNKSSAIKHLLEEKKLNIPRINALGAERLEVIAVGLYQLNRLMDEMGIPFDDFLCLDLASLQLIIKEFIYVCFLMEQHSLSFNTLMRLNPEHLTAVLTTPICSRTEKIIHDLKSQITTPPTRPFHNQTSVPDGIFPFCLNL